MIDTKFLGIKITDSDDYGTIHLRLALDLLTSIRERAEEKIIEDKARNIIQVCCEPMFDYLTEAYDWNLEEVNYAEEILVQRMDDVICDLLTLAKRRIKHVRKHERRTKLQIDDFKVAAMIAYVMTVPDEVRKKIEDTFLEDHGAMNFSR